MVSVTLAYSLSKRCMVGKDISNTSKVYKLTHKNYVLYIYMLNCFSLFSTDVYTSEYTLSPANPCNIYNVIQY